MRKELRTAAWIGALIASIVGGWWTTGRAEARGRAEQQRADSIAFDGVLARAEATWSVRTAVAVESVADSLRVSQDSALARLGVDLQGARARVRQLEGVRLTLEGRVAGLADSLVVLEGDSLPAEVSGPVSGVGGVSHLPSLPEAITQRWLVHSSLCRQVALAPA